MHVTTNYGVIIVQLKSSGENFFPSLFFGLKNEGKNRFKTVPFSISWIYLKDYFHIKVEIEGRSEWFLGAL